MVFSSGLHCTQTLHKIDALSRHDFLTITRSFFATLRLRASLQGQLSLIVCQRVTNHLTEGSLINYPTIPEICYRFCIHRTSHRNTVKVLSHKHPQTLAHHMAPWMTRICLSFTVTAVVVSCPSGRTPGPTQCRNAKSPDSYCLFPE